MILAPAEPQHPHAGAVIRGGVLEGFAAGDLDDLDIDSDTVPGREPEIPERSLDCRESEPD